jgi:hypothetical protein
MHQFIQLNSLCFSLCIEINCVRVIDIKWCNNDAVEFNPFHAITSLQVVCI